jgi:integrase
MISNLVKRGNRYSIRRKIPSDLQAHYGKTETVKALGTSDPTEAANLCRAESVRQDQEFAAVRASFRTVPFEPSREEVEANEEMRLIDWGAEDSANQAEQEKRAARREEIRSVLLEVLGVVPGPAVAAPVAIISPTATIAPATRRKSTLLADRPGRGAYAPVPVVVMHLAGLVEKWARERKPNSRTIDIADKVVERFYQHCGRFPLSEITRRHVIDFKDKLLAAGQTPVNTDKQLTILRTLLNFAIANDLTQNNAAVGIKVGERKNARAVRLPFDAGALQAIFSSPVYTENFRPKGCAGEAAYWIPLLALFTGARLEELAQLRPVDIYEDTYHDTDDTERRVWVLRITNEGEGQGVKNVGSVRRFPIHAELLKRGFLEYVKARAALPRIFESLKVDKYGAEGAVFGNWFGKYLRIVCKVEDRRMVFHSFRHGFKDAAREAGVPEDVADAITGHAGGGVARRYGGLNYPLRPLVDAIEKIKIRGLVLPN